MQFPKIKTSHPITIKGKELSIGDIPGSAFKIEDYPEWFEVFLKKLDGSNTIKDIQRELFDLNFKVDVKLISEIINELSLLGCLEDGGDVSSALSFKEMELYSRQLVLFSLREKLGRSAHFYQSKLKSQKIVIFGVGGWGSWVALNLALAGIGHITLVDKDKVELSNLNRQVLFNKNHIGKLKVIAAKESLEQHNPYITIEVIAEYIKRDRNQIKKALNGASLAFITWTNLSYFYEESVENLIHEVAFTESIPVIEVSADPLEIVIGPIFTNDKKSPCFKCIKEKIKDQFYSNKPSIKSLQDQRLKDWALSSREGSSPSWQTAPSLSAMAGLITDQAIKLISRYEEPFLIGKRFKFSFIDFKSEVEELKKAPNCVQCK